MNQSRETKLTESFTESLDQNGTNAIYIGLGSNLGESTSILTSAVACIAQLEQTQLIDCSSFYVSQPLDDLPQPLYLNAVVEITSNLAPLDLLVALQTIECQWGRDHSADRWASRTLDLDILLYGQTVIDTPQLMIPHYGLAERDFVIYPLYEIAPNLQIPNHGRLVALKKACRDRGLQRVP